MCRWLLPAAGLVLGISLTPVQADAPDTKDKWIALTPKLDVWQNSPKDWAVAGAVALDPANPRRLTYTSSTTPTALVTEPAGARNLVTREKFGDQEVHVEFLIPKGSNSGVKFHGLYEMQIIDSFGKKEPTAADCGGVYPRAEW